MSLSLHQHLSLSLPLSIYIGTFYTYIDPSLYIDSQVDRYLYVQGLATHLVVPRQRKKKKKREVCSSPVFGSLLSFSLTRTLSLSFFLCLDSLSLIFFFFFLFEKR